VNPLVRSLNVGLVREIRLGDTTARSAIFKQPADGRVALGPLGLDGDAQADLSVHGGTARAVYAYPIEHYPFWQTVRAQARVAAWDAVLAPGALGENLTLEGLLEPQAWIGDVLRFPDCELAVSAPRFPCDKLNAALGFRHAAKLMVQNGWCGFYLAVRRPGTLATGESAELVAGPREVQVQELFRARMRGRT